MRAFNKKKKPKHSTKSKYFFDGIACSISFCNIYRQKYNYSKKRSYIDIIAVMFQCNNVHFYIERYSPRFTLI